MHIIGIVADTIHVVTRCSTIDVRHIEIGIIPRISPEVLSYDALIPADLILYFGHPVDVVPFVGL